MVKDDPNSLGSLSVKEISLIVASVSIGITMIAATGLMVIVGLSVDWTEEKNQAVGLELMTQVGILFSAIGHSSILLIGLGAGTGSVALGMAMANKKRGADE